MGLLDQAFGEQVPEYVLSFTKILCEKGHIRQFSACVEEYENLHRAVSEVSAARIVSAVELTKEEKAALMKKLKDLTAADLAAAAQKLALDTVYFLKGEAQ